MPRAKKENSHLSLPVEQVLKELGRSLDLARKKRRISVRELATRMMVSPTTVIKLTKGDPGVHVGALATALWIMGMHKRLGELVTPEKDSIGMSEDLKSLPKRVRRKKPADDIDF